MAEEGEQQTALSDVPNADEAIAPGGDKALAVGVEIEGAYRGWICVEAVLDGVVGAIDEDDLAGVVGNGDPTSGGVDLGGVEFEGMGVDFVRGGVRGEVRLADFSFYANPDQVLFWKIAEG